MMQDMVILVSDRDADGPARGGILVDGSGGINDDNYGLGVSDRRNDDDDDWGRSVRRNDDDDDWGRSDNHEGEQDKDSWTRHVFVDFQYRKRNCICITKHKILILCTVLSYKI